MLHAPYGIPSLGSRIKWLLSSAIKKTFDLKNVVIPGRGSLCLDSLKVTHVYADHSNALQDPPGRLTKDRTTDTPTLGTQVNPEGNIEPGSAQLSSYKAIQVPQPTWAQKRCSPEHPCASLQAKSLPGGVQTLPHTGTRCRR